MDQSLERLVSPVSTHSISFYLSLHLLFRLNSTCGMEAHHVYLLALASKTHVRGSPRQGILCYSSGRQWLR